MLLILILSQFIWAQDPQLEGVWSQPCLGHVARQESFSGTSVRLTESFFADKSCSHHPLMDFSSSGTFSASAGAIDFAFRQTSITLQDPLYVEDFNQRKVCAIDHWQQGKVEDVTGRFCEIFGPGLGIQVPRSGQMRYGIYKIEKDRLFFGRLSVERDASHPDKRPQEFDERYFTRQQPGQFNKKNRRPTLFGRLLLWYAGALSPEKFPASKIIFSIDRPRLAQ